jgi:probable phosphoglycerate mutase
VTRGLVLLRHGATAWNRVERAQGQTDVPLDEVGRAQAAAVAPYLGALGPAGIWSSDLSRAAETAELLGAAAGVEVKYDARLREYDVGVRQGLTRAEAADRLPGLPDPWDLSATTPVPGAETHDEVAARVVAAVREALASLADGELGLVVSHGAALRLAVGGLLGWDRATISTLRGMDNCQWATVHQSRPGAPLRLAQWGAGLPVGGVVADGG